MWALSLGLGWWLGWRAGLNEASDSGTSMGGAAESGERATSRVLNRSRGAPVSERSRLASRVEDPETAHLADSARSSATSPPRAPESTAQGAPVARPRPAQRVGQAAPFNLDEALASWESLPPGRSKDSRLMNLIRRWAKGDGATAAAYANSLSRAPFRESAVGQALRTWAKNEPEAALDWALENPSPGTREQRLPEVLYGIADKDPMAALGILADLGVGRLSQLSSTTRTLVSRVDARKQRDELITWSQALPEGRLKRQVVSDLAYQWGNRDPESAARWVSALQDGQTRAQASSQLISAWSRKDPESTASWVIEQVDEDKRGQQLARVMDHWMNYDINAAAEWLNQFPSGTQTDPAVARLAYKVMNHDPEGAMSWAESISDSRKRINTMHQVARKWKSADPSALERFLNTSSLTQQEKATLRK